MGRESRYASTAMRTSERASFFIIEEIYYRPYQLVNRKLFTLKFFYATAVVGYRWYLQLFTSGEPMLIILEGADGAGTTTQSAALFQYLLKHHPETKPVLTAEPSSTPVGHLIRSLLRDKRELLLPAEMAALFFADRKAHFRDIISPALEKDHWVVCDRNWQSSLVYQGLIASSEDTDFVKRLNRQFTTIKSACYVLDVSAAETKRRRSTRNTQPEAYETDDIQEKVIAAYKRVPEHDSTAVLLPCENKTVLTVHQDIVSHLRPFLIT